jgi:hypothetical protein
VWIYNLHIRELDSRTSNEFFIGYALKSKGFRFYCPSHSTKIVESINVNFLEDSEHSESAYPQKVELEKAQELTKAHLSKWRLIMLKEIQIDYLEPQSISPHEEQVQNKPTQPLPNAEEVELIRSYRIIRPTIPSDYVVCLQKSDLEVGPKDDPKLFSQAMNGDNSTSCFNDMKEEMKSMAKKQV